MRATMLLGTCARDTPPPPHRLPRMFRRYPGAHDMFV
jgi:hypothetical protein